MSILTHLSTFALRHVVDGACSRIGLQNLSEKIGDVTSDKVVDFLTARFIDHSQRLTEALGSPTNAPGNRWRSPWPAIPSGNAARS